MNQRKQSLKTLILGLQAISLAALIATSFIGGIYIFNGNLLFSIPISLVFVVGMYYLVSEFMKAKTNKKRNGYSSQFYAMFGLFIVLSLAVSFFVLHCFNVEVSEKKAIQELGLSKADCLDRIHTDYKNKYENFLSKQSTDLNHLFNRIREMEEDASTLAIKAQLKLPPYNFTDTMIDAFKRSSNLTQSVNDRISALRTKFKNKDQSLLPDLENYLNNKRQVFKGWNRLALNSTLKELDEKINEHQKELSETLTVTTAGQVTMQPLESDCTRKSLIDDPSALLQKHIGAVSLVIILLFNLLILMPFFLTAGRKF